MYLVRRRVLAHCPSFHVACPFFDHRVFFSKFHPADGPKRSSPLKVAVPVLGLMIAPVPEARQFFLGNTRLGGVVFASSPTIKAPLFFSPNHSKRILRGVW